MLIKSAGPPAKERHVSPLALHPGHLADLNKSGLTDETIRAAAIYTVNPDEIGKKLGGLANGVVFALAFPYPGHDGFERYKVWWEDGRQDKAPKYLQRGGTLSHLYFPPGIDLAGDSTLLITEGEKKCLALWQTGYQVLGIGGVWNWLTKGENGKSRPIADLALVNWKRFVAIIFDSDGHDNPLVRLAAFRLGRELAKRGAAVSILFLPHGSNGEKQGADDFLVAHGEAAFGELLETAWSFEPGWTDKEAEFWWELRGTTKESPRAETLKRLQALVPVLALMDNVEVAGLLDILKDRLGLSGQMVAALRRDIKETKEKIKKARSDQTDKPALSPEEEIKALKPLASPLAGCPDILGEVAVALSRRGLAGQVREAKIIYLALTTRVLEAKVLVNLAVKGPSSGGKSFIVEVVLEFFPPSAFYALSAMSERALAYSQEPLAHRFMVIYEAAGLGSDFAQYLMRSLLSEGRVRYETVEKTKEGLMPRLIEREGPTGLIVTTTRTGLHPENETRMMTLEVDDTPEQTREVLLAHADGEKPKTVDLSSFKALQRILELERPQIVVPFAKALAQGCDPTAIRLRRDFPAVITLIKAHAILHSPYREKDAQGRVIAKLEDYAAVYDLVGDLVSYGTGQKVPEKMQETVEAVRLLAEKAPEGVTYSAIGKHVGIDESAARRRVHTAIKRGYLENRETRRGCAAKIAPGEPLSAGKEVLPHPKSLADSTLETTADLPAKDDYLYKSDGYGRHSGEPTDCQPPTDVPAGSGPEEPEGGQAVGKGSAELGADRNLRQFQHIQPGSAGRHEYQGGIDGKIFISGGLGVEEPPPPEGEPKTTEVSNDDAIAESGPFQCGNCQNFTASLGAPGGRGHCSLGEKSWNGMSTQFSDAPHPCQSFDAKDSIKALAAWDESIGKVVEAAVQALNPDGDLKEVVIR